MSETGAERQVEHQRVRLVRQIEVAVETPMAVLGLIWLALAVIELIEGANPALEALGLGIWIIFLLEFALRLVVAPRKLKYLRRRWLIALSLALPALRITRLVRVARLARVARYGRQLRLARLLSSLNRGFRSLRRTMRRRGIAYVLGLTVIVLFAGAAGMFAFERGANPGFVSYGSAVYWTAMIITTMGSEYWPRTTEGRLLAILISVYAIGVFGYITATLASFFVGRDREDDQEGELAGLRKEIAALRAKLESP